jgi:DNA-binding response OmpR family regulator
MVNMPDTPNEPKKIMIIEDDHFLSSLMKARLEKEGFTVTQAFDGEEAMQLLKQDLPSLIVLDLIMPKVTGFEVLQMISITPQLDKVPVVILSNLAQDSDIQKAQELGAKEYFVKVKVSIDDLVARIKILAV